MPELSTINDTITFNELAHYALNTGPTYEFGAAAQIEPAVKNVGWTLGNDCPYRCTHCYSMNARVKGRDMSVEMIDRVVDQLVRVGVKTVNLGGNEPLFTNGPNPRDTLLPYIIERLSDADVEVGLTTSGISLLHLYRDHRDSFNRLNDVDVSFDSPFEAEHDNNRGARVFKQAIDSLKICQDHDKAHTVIMCAMSWNSSDEHIDGLVRLARQYGANVRINPIKPVKPEHMVCTLQPERYYQMFARLLDQCDPIDLGEPTLAAICNADHARRLPCGRSSFRIHSITPSGEIYVSPCVYMHDYKAPIDLLKHDLADIIASDQFRVFRQRNRNAQNVQGCAECELLEQCGGGCAARSFLHHLHETGEKTMLARDPYCPREHGRRDRFIQKPALVTGQRLVHMDYLCTWIGRPKQ